MIDPPILLPMRGRTNPPRIAAVPPIGGGVWPHDESLDQRACGDDRRQGRMLSRAAPGLTRAPREERPEHDAERAGEPHEGRRRQVVDPLARGPGIARHQEEHQARPDDPLDVHEGHEDLIGVGNEDDGERARPGEAGQRATRRKRPARDVERDRHGARDKKSGPVGGVDRHGEEGHHPQDRVQVPGKRLRERVPAVHVGPVVEIGVLGPELGMGDRPGPAQAEDDGAHGEDQVAGGMGHGAREGSPRIQAALFCDALDHLKKQIPIAVSDTAIPTNFMMAPAVSWSIAGVNPAIRRGAYS